MFEGRQKAEWARTSSSMALLAELNRDRQKKSTPFSPADFNPYAEKAQAIKADKATQFKMLKQAFIGLGKIKRGQKIAR
jgi:hypothetical protein